MSFRLLLAGLFAACCVLAAPAAEDTRVIYPGRNPAPGAGAPAPAPGLGAFTTVGLIVVAGAAGWMLWRGRKLPFAGRDLRKLAIDETRSLGSRQYLVVASYEGRKILLGVCPGRIDLLTTLDPPSPRDPAR